MESIALTKFGFLILEVNSIKSNLKTYSLPTQNFYSVSKYRIAQMKHLLMDRTLENVSKWNQLLNQHSIGLIEYPLKVRKLLPQTKQNRKKNTFPMNPQVRASVPPTHISSPFLRIRLAMA